MQTRDRQFAAAMVALIAIFWLGLFVHSSPRFAGSALGGAFGVMAALLLLPPLALSAAKRIPGLRGPHTAQVLTAHVNCGVVATVLALIHTGHKFSSVLGLALMTTLLATVLSGYVGFYFYRFTSQRQHEKERDLTALQIHLAKVASGSDGSGDHRLPAQQLAGEVESIAAVVADLEYAIHFEDVVQNRLRGWVRFHLACSVAFYVLLGLHIWAAVGFGLRWFE